MTTGQLAFNYLKAMIGDKKPEQGDDSIRESISPIDFVPYEAAAPVAKAALKNAQKHVANEVGSFAFDDDIPKMIKNMKGNYSKENVLKNLNLAPTTNTEQLMANRQKLHELLNASTMERLGNTSNINKEHVAQDILDKFYPEVSKLGLPVQMNPYMKGAKGQYKYLSKSGAPGIVIPQNITLKDNSPFIAMHEAQHFRDTVNNPFFKSEPELIPTFTDDNFTDLIGSQYAGYLGKKVNKTSPTINKQQAVSDIGGLMKDKSLRNFGKEFIEQYLPKNKIDPYDFVTSGHFYEYPTNFELNKSIELLDDKLPKINPKQLTENYKNIKSISDKFADRRYNTPYEADAVRKEIIDEYEKAKFPNLSKLLEE